MLPHPTKHGASLEILTALGCKYKNTREHVLHRRFNLGACWHSHVSHIFFTLFPESRVISNTTGRRRDGESSMEREKPAGVRRCGGEGWAASRTQRALVPGLRALGNGHTRPEQDLAQLLCCAQGQHPALQGLCSVLPLTGRTEKEETNKKPGNGPSLPFPHRCTVSNTPSTLHLYLPGQVRVPWGLRMSVLGRRCCPFPSPTHPASTAMCRVLCCVTPSMWR